MKSIKEQTKERIEQLETDLEHLAIILGNIPSVSRYKLFNEPNKKKLLKGLEDPFECEYRGTVEAYKVYIRENYYSKGEMIIKLKYNDFYFDKSNPMDWDSLKEKLTSRIKHFETKLAYYQKELLELDQNIKEFNLFVVEARKNFRKFEDTVLSYEASKFVSEYQRSEFSELKS